MTVLFLELNCEEIPARMQGKAIADLERLFLRRFPKAALHQVKAARLLARAIWHWKLQA